MGWADWIKIIIEILSGMLVCIPLVIKLYECFKELTQTKIVAEKEKNWDKLWKIALDLMTEAEGRFSEGEARKAWVLNSLRAMASTLEYEYDEIAEAKVSTMIDAICEASKNINTIRKEKKNAL